MLDAVPPSIDMELCGEEKREEEEEVVSSTPLRVAFKDNKGMALDDPDHRGVGEEGLSLAVGRTVPEGVREERKEKEGEGDVVLTVLPINTPFPTLLPIPPVRLGINPLASPEDEGVFKAVEAPLRMLGMLEGIDVSVRNVGVGTIEEDRDKSGEGVLSVGVGAIDKVWMVLKLGGATVSLTVPPWGGERVEVREAPMEKEGVEEGVFSVGVGAMEADRESPGVRVRSVGVGATDSVELMLKRGATVWLGVNVGILGVAEELELE